MQLVKKRSRPRLWRGGFVVTAQIRESGSNISIHIHFANVSDEPRPREKRTWPQQRSKASKKDASWPLALVAGSALSSIDRMARSYLWIFLPERGQKPNWPKQSDENK